MIDEIHLDSAGCIDRNPPHVRTFVLAEPFDRVEDGVVLDRRCGHDRIGDTQPRATGPPEPLDGEVVGFGSTGGEHNCRGSRAQIVGDGLTSLFHDAASSTTGRMQGRRITSNGRSVQPGLSCLGKQRCRCRVVNKVPGGAMYSAPGRGAREIHIACRIHVGIVTHCPMVARKIAQSVGAAVDLVGQLGNNFEEVPDHAKVSKLEQRCFGVLIHHNDHLGGLHAGAMLNSARNSVGDVQLR